MRVDVEAVVGAIALAFIVAAVLSLVLSNLYSWEPSGDWGEWSRLLSSIVSSRVEEKVFEKEYVVNDSISLHAVVSNGGLIVYDNMTSDNRLKIVVAEKTIGGFPKAYFVNVSDRVVDVRVDGYVLYVYAPTGSITSVDYSGVNSGLLVNLSSSRSLHYFRVNTVNSGAKILLHDIANTSISLNSTTSGVEALFYYDPSGNEAYSSIDVGLRESGAKIGIVAPGYAFNINFDGSMSGVKITVDNESFSATSKWFYVDNDYSSNSKRIDIRLNADMSGVRLWVEKNK